MSHDNWSCLISFSWLWLVGICVHIPDDMLWICHLCKIFLFSESGDSDADQDNGPNTDGSDAQEERGKKWKRNPDIWLQNKKKCCLKCTSKVTEQERIDMFHNFWLLGSFYVQNAYLTGLVKIHPTKQHWGRKDAEVSRWASSQHYHINTKDGHKIVCKDFFLGTFDISNGRLDRAIKNQKDFCGVMWPDGRSRHQNRPNKTSDQKIASVTNHIRMFPTDESHTREHQHDWRYLSSDLNVEQMYQLYVEKCAVVQETPVGSIG